MSKKGVNLLMYDLKCSTAKERKSYADFHKFIISLGYVMLQESIYYKYVTNLTLTSFLTLKVKRKAPKDSKLLFINLTLKEIKLINENSSSKIEIEDVMKNVLVI